MGKTTRPLRYDLIQIPYDYTVDMRNRFKELKLIHRVPEEVWTEVCDIVHETGTITGTIMSRPSQEKEVQKGKMVV